MMANILPITVLMVFLVLAPNLGWGCTSNSGRTPSWDINDNAEIYPTYDAGTGAVGAGVEIRFRRKRGASPVPPSKSKLFTRLDMNKNGQIQLEEWVAAHGQAENFEEFLKADDTNGDGQISLAEFKQISGVTFNQH